MPRAPLAWVTLLALALGAYGAAFFALQDPGPSAEQVAAQAARLRPLVGEDDLILLLPAYATRAREHLGDLDVVATRRPLDEDLQARPQVWLFGLFGAAASPAGVLTQEGWQTIARWSEDGVEVIGLENPSPWRVERNLLDMISSLRVEHLLGDGRVEPCDEKVERPHPRWVCPRDSAWMYVGPEWHRMGEVTRRCLWAHPPTQGALRIRVPLPRGGVLVGHAGHTLNGSVRARAPVNMAIEVEGDGGRTLTFPLEATWRPFRIQLEGVGTATTAFTIWSADSGANHFCFTADVRRSRS